MNYDLDDFTETQEEPKFNNYEKLCIFFGAIVSMLGVFVIILAVSNMIFSVVYLIHDFRPS